MAKVVASNQVFEIRFFRQISPKNFNQFSRINLK